MDNSRSRFEALNAGRQRRSAASLEDLARTLDTLESRFEKTRLAAEQAPAAAHPSRERLTRRSLPAASSIDEDRITSEIKALRAELRHQMGTGLKREFQTFRNEMTRTDSGEVGDLSRELERLNHAVSAIGAKGDPRDVRMLHAELNEVKSELGRLAREESLQAVDRRWDDFDRRWNAFEERVSAPARDDLAPLTQRMDQIASALDRLPESPALKALDTKVRTLADVIERLNRSQDEMAGAAFAAIDARLDEITRAIAAAPSRDAGPGFDPDIMERIEARISLLGRQLEDAAMARDGADLAERLTLLQDRMDDMVLRSEGPEQALERLNMQMRDIAARLDTVSAPMDEARIADTIDDRLSLFSETLGEKLREVEATSLAQNNRTLEAIEDRISALADRIEAARPAEVGESALEVIESRLNDMARRIEQAGTGSVDLEAIRLLENEIASLSERLGDTQFSSDSRTSVEIDDRLARVEASLESNRDAILEAARMAAESAVTNFSGSEQDREAVSALASDLKSLENLARRSDDRNARTFEAIHDTLLKIVDRLTALEATPHPKLAIPAAPPIDAASAIEQHAQVQPPRASRTPAEAAAEAAFAALNDGDTRAGGDARQRKSSLLGGIARVFNGSKATEAGAPVLAGDVSVEPEVEEAPDLDAPIDPRKANAPIEPGQGGPDLNAIMRRVRAERREPVSDGGEKDTARADFIAAARRAAQAAAAEAETLKKDEAGKPAKSARFSFGAARRKPILMAVGALLVVIAGFQLSGAFLKPAEQAAVTAPTAPSTERASDTPTPSAAVAAADVAPREDAASQAPAVRSVEPASPAEDAASQNVAAVPAEAPMADQGEIASTVEAAPELETITVDDIPAEAGPLPLRLAAAKGDPKAYFEIGARYDEGRGVEQNRETAAGWYERAAEAGLAPAQYRLGSFHEKGTGVELDVEKAKTWYQLAAAQGNASAMHNLAVLFAMGPEGTPDNSAAARWFLEAAELGVKDSQFNMGIMAAKGAGVPQSLEESYKWFALAARQGDKDAAEKRDEVANALRPEQLEKARATTELWNVKPIKSETNVVDIPTEWKDAADHTASIDMKQAVSNIQRILNKNGYDAGSADGVMGTKTKAAISAFQKDVGLDPTGEVSEPLVRELLARK